MVEPKESLLKRVAPNKPQAVAVGGVVAMLVAIQPIKNSFFTREEGLAHLHRIEVLETTFKESNKASEERANNLRNEFKAEIMNLKTDLVTMLKQNTDLFLARNSETTSRTIDAFRAEFSMRDSQFKELKEEVRELSRSQPAKKR